MLWTPLWHCGHNLNQGKGNKKTTGSKRALRMDVTDMESED